MENNSHDNIFGGSLPERSSDGYTGQEDDHHQECGPKGHQDDSTSQHHVEEDGKMQNHEEMSRDVDHKLDKSNSINGDIDTNAPFESVKEAVSMFSGIVDWKAHKIQIAERRKRVAKDLRKANEEISLLKKKSEAAEESKQQVLKELDNSKRRVEELKLNLESAQTEESEAKQDSELTKLIVDEMEQGVADESSVAAKEQLQVVQARHQAALSELEVVKLELKNLEKDYTLLVSERDLAIQNAQEAVSTSTETEREVEELTIKMITTKEALETAHGAYLEAEEHRTGIVMEREQEVSSMEEELKQSEEEWQKVAETEDLKSKLDAASILLQDLKEESASYMEGSHKDIQSEIDSAKRDLQEVKLNIENTTDEVNNMKLYASSLNMELEQEKAILIQQNKGTESVLLASLEADLLTTISEVIQMNEKEARLKTLELPEQLEKAAEEADQAKSRAQKTRSELKKAKAAAKKAKNKQSTMMSKLNTAVRGVEAARASERLAHGAVSAVEESEFASSESEAESEITLCVEKYSEVSRKAKEAEDEANERVSEAISQIDIAKASEQKAEKKLEEVKSDLVSRKEKLSTTRHKAEKAKEGKMVVEQELRIWRSENEQRRKAKAERKKKKQSLIPGICMFLCRRKGPYSNKNKT